MTATATLPVPGARLHFEVRGSGPLLLLIGDHGGFGGPTTPAFAARLREAFAGAGGTA